MMRHSDPRLTMSAYTKLELADTRAAVDLLDLSVPLSVPLHRHTSSLTCTYEHTNEQGLTLDPDSPERLEPAISAGSRGVEARGLEPLTSSLQSWRSPN